MIDIIAAEGYYGRLGDITGRIEGKESYSYSDNDMYISDYPEEIKKDVRQIVRGGYSNKERMLSLPNSCNISI